MRMLLSICILLSGCYETSVRVRRTSLEVVEGVARPVEGPALVLDVWGSQGRLFGQVRRLDVCQVATLDHVRSTIIRERGSDDTANSALGVVGGLAVLGGLAIVISVATEEPMPRDPDDRYGLASGLESMGDDIANGTGGVLMGAGVLMAAPALHVLLQEPEKTVTHRETYRVKARQPGQVACGTGPVMGLGLRIVDEVGVVGHSTTDGMGQVIFFVGRRPVETLRVVAEKVPLALTALVKEGEALPLAPPR